MAKLMSQKAYAQSIGVSKQYINKLVRSGALPTQNSRIDPDVADGVIQAQRELVCPLRRNTTPPEVSAVSSPLGQSPRQGISTAELPTLLLKTRIKSETEKAKLLEIKAKVEAGKYIDRDEAETQIFKHFRPLRDNLLTIPDRLDAELAATNDRHIVHKILYNEIVRVLDDANKPALKPKR